MNGRFFQSRIFKFSLTVVAAIAAIGTFKLSGNLLRNSEPVAQATEEEITRVATEGKEAGIAQGQREGIEATLEGEPDALAVQASALLDKSSELAESDLQALICARGNAYLTSASDLAETDNINVERWLRAQLKGENDRVKALLVTHGSLSGTANQVNQIQSALTNRAAILYALANIGSPVSCRVSPYESTDSIDTFIYRANSIDQQQQTWGVGANE